MTSESSRPTAKRILVVDDSADTVRMMRMLLKLAGFEVRTASDGEEALAAAADFRPEVILLDLTLPGLSGLEVAACIRQQPELAGTRIIAASGHDLDGTPPGFDALMVKPLDHERLVRLLRQPAPG